MNNHADNFQNYKEVNYDVDHEELEFENGEKEKITYVLPKKSSICNKNLEITNCMNNECIKFDKYGYPILKKSITDITTPVYETKSLNSISCNSTEDF
jgi:hypothetical protein